MFFCTNQKRRDWKTLITKKKEKKKTVKDKEAENIIEWLRIEIRSPVRSRAWASGTVQVQNGC